MLACPVLTSIDNDLILIELMFRNVVDVVVVGDLNLM